MHNFSIGLERLGLYNQLIAVSIHLNPKNVSLKESVEFKSVNLSPTPSTYSEETPPTQNIPLYCI